jgi:hypothetical protein
MKKAPFQDKPDNLWRRIISRGTLHGKGKSGFFWKEKSPESLLRYPHFRLA